MGGFHSQREKNQGGKRLEPHRTSARGRRGRGRGEGEGGGEVSKPCSGSVSNHRPVRPSTSGSFYLNLRLLANRYKCTDIASSGISCNFLQPALLLFTKEASRGL
jgi:hypothetical protein